MELSTIVEDPHVARRAFLDYREQLRRPLREKATEAEKELRELDRELLQAYRQLAKGVTLLRLEETIAAGGVELRGREGHESSLPRLAVASALARTVWTHGVSPRGNVLFSWQRTPRWNDLSRAARNSIALEAAFAEGEWNQRVTYERTVYAATVPTVPPEHRPESLVGYHILFEAVWEDTPQPADPALLKHVGGDLWAVVATWDLSPLEAAVLSRRR